MLEIPERSEEEGLQVAIIFHSHLRCPPIPSPDDLHGIELWNVPWLITDGRKRREGILKDWKAVKAELILE
ncbi:Mov34/MPN/PAD-1 family protein [Thermococcus sp.]